MAMPRAAETAAALPDVIAWAGTPYSGETRNGRPHDHGVMTFTHLQSVVAAYRGELPMGRARVLALPSLMRGLCRRASG